MRVLISYILLSVFVFNTLGYIVTFKFAQLQIKREVKKELKSTIKASELHSFQLSKNEFETLQWLEYGREFILNGKMYDIVKKEYQKDSIVISCIDDKQEKKLFANLEDHINKYITNGKSSSRKELKLNDSSIKYHYSWMFSIAKRFPKKIIHATQQSFSINLFDIDPAFPPPRII